MPKSIILSPDDLSTRNSFSSIEIAVSPRWNQKTNIVFHIIASMLGSGVKSVRVLVSADSTQSVK